MPRWLLGLREVADAKNSYVWQEHNYSHRVTRLRALSRNSKSKVIYWMLFALYIFIVRSRVFNYFLVHLKGEEFAREFREKRRITGNKVIK